MRVSEIFYSLQGEGTLAGIPGVFVRLTYCPLRCKWCDTKYAWNKIDGTGYSIESIVEEVQRAETNYVVVTGGEPMAEPALPLLIKKLKQAGLHITIETAGIIFVPDLDCDLMSISPKLSNSIPDEAEPAKIHNDSRLEIAVLSKLIDSYNYQLKFVVDSPDDLFEIRKVLEEVESINNYQPENVMLMPQARTREELYSKMEMVSQMCMKTGFAFCHRLQVLLWDNARGR